MTDKGGKRGKESCPDTHRVPLIRQDRKRPKQSKPPSK